MGRYNFLKFVIEAGRGHQHWQPAWRDGKPRARYEVVVVGGGGHGLATAYYLAKEHGVRSVAVLERGWIGGGNSGRNTQVVRSNYFFPESAAFFEHSLRLYETLARSLNFNVMLSQRGLIVLAHSEHDLDFTSRCVNASLMNGIAAEAISAAEIKRREPLIELNGRFPVLGGYVQDRAGIARHDAVVWGFARAASELGVDIAQNCEVAGFRIEGGRVSAVETAAGTIEADAVVLSVAGSSSVLAAKAGLALPVHTMTLQALVSEPVKPALRSIVLSGSVHAYVSQSDRGEIVIGGGADGYTCYSQRGGLPQTMNTINAVVELFPSLSRLRLMRQWGGAVDITPDTSPIMGLTPLKGLYINCGWGTGGFKAIPAGGHTMAWTIANGRPHPLIGSFALDRFLTGALIDEGAAAGVAH